MAESEFFHVNVSSPSGHRENFAIGAALLARRA